MKIIQFICILIQYLFIYKIYLNFCNFTIKNTPLIKKKELIL